MKKRILRQIISVISTIILVTSFTPVQCMAGFSANGESPNYYTVCGNLPYHQMMPKCMGDVYIGSNPNPYIVNGYCWQCENCYLVLVTEGTIIFDEMTTIGKWGEALYNWPIDTNVQIVYATSYGYCSQNHMDGYHFDYYHY